jgi:methionine synthase II (cobalamin-independent)
MWMKGDFKEKLEQESPEWVKRRIEMGLDKMVDDLSNR